MKGTVHLASGALLSIGVAFGTAYTGHIIDPPSLIAFSTACILGSVFPDIDNKRSMIGKHLHFLRWCQGTKNHRDKLPHTPIFLAFTLVLFSHLYKGMYKEAIMYGWALGYLMHLILDTFTAGGIRWLIRRVSLWHGKSNGKFEIVAMSILVMLMSALSTQLATKFLP